MAAKKSQANGAKQKPNKAAFIRSFPETAPAKDVVAKAKDQGITLTENHVSAVRSLMRAKAGKGKKAAKPAKAAKAAPANGAPAKAAPRAGKAGGSKTGFILSFPESVSAAAVVSKGKEKGLAFSEKYVWAIRSSARRKGGKTAKAAHKTAAAPATARASSAPAKAPKAAKAAAAPAKRGPGRPPRAAAAIGGTSLERGFLQLVLDIGLHRAEALLKDVRAKVGALA